MWGGWSDLIDYLGSDPNTESIVIYMESVGDARSFLSAAREVALTKPIIVIKAGRSEIAAKAAASHTGSLAGSDAVLDAGFRRVGVLRVNELEDIFQMTEVLARQPRPAGGRARRIGCGRTDQRRGAIGNSIARDTRFTEPGFASPLEPRKPDRCDRGCWT